MVTYVDRNLNQVTFAGTLSGVAENAKAYAGSSKDNEITGIKRIFDTTEQNKVLYALEKDRLFIPFAHRKTELITTF